MELSYVEWKAYKMQKDDLTARNIRLEHKFRHGQLRISIDKEHYYYMDAYFPDLNLIIESKLF